VRGASGHGIWGTDRWGARYSEGRRGSNPFESIQNSNGFNLFENLSNFERPKKDLPEFENFEIKYGFEGFEERNNSLHRNFFRSDVDLESENREASRSEIQ
jgi:hypothetical protein